MSIKSFKPKLPILNIPVLNESKSFSSKGKLKLIPLGGVGDVTKNMYVYEYEQDIVIIDCGVGFPDEGMLGIDLVIPDISYLRDKKSLIKGIVITHGHEDHIGGLPYIWPELDVPIFAPPLASGFIRGKFDEHRLPKDKIKTVKPTDSFKLGVFEISFYRISHSIPDTVGVVMRTPVGTLVHQADFKIDWTPVIDQKPDIGRIAEIGNSGVDFMTIDCLRSEKPGYTPSEKTIEKTFQDIAEKSVGKILITMTSSNISRMQQAINVAIKSGRKIALAGRSMEGNFQVARDLSYLDIPPGLVIAQDEVKRFPANKLMVLIAGAQGQPDSALARAANGDHKFIQLLPEDTIIISADPIPSTESAQSALIDTLGKNGCDVYYTAVQTDLHVSGHAAREELKLMLNLVKPRHILPIGGNFKHMVAFSKLAQDQGYQKDQILLPDNGSVIEIGQNQARIQGSVEVSNVYVDGLGIGDVGTVVLRDRQVLSEDGVVVVVVGINKKTSQFSTDPDIISRGFVYEREADGLIEAAKGIVINCLKNHTPSSVGMDWRYIRKSIEDDLERFFYHQTNRRPMILTIVVDL